ncbi:MAG TPA: 30S ribosomal protein S30 [Deltaproteobacteria bacterium]|nr:30S ribosomal protein S30 [Deltaproteobacteria bacterium]
MQVPVQVIFRNMKPSEAIEAEIRDRTAKLEHFFSRIVSCRITMEAPHHHHRQGKLFHVRIDLKIPGVEIVINRDPGKNHAHEDPYVAVRDAFDAAKRRLEDYIRRHYTQNKEHEIALVARVSKIFPFEDYGFLETKEGKEIFFHRNSVLNGAFDLIDIGSKVRFVEEMGEKGPQASSVRLM